MRYSLLTYSGSFPSERRNNLRHEFRDLTTELTVIHLMCITASYSTALTSVV